MNTFFDIYDTIAARERHELKIKGSRFIASAAPVKTKEEALDFVESIRKEFHDATHNCYAYRLGEGGLLFRAVDDGEPSGSAGKPILFSLQKASVSDVCLVVTRYFGGTKLGVGGLARAYSQAADEVLATCARVPVVLTVAVKVFCVYEDVHIIKQLLEKYAYKSEELYHDAVEFIAHVRKNDIEPFRRAITERTNARAGSVLL